MSANISPSDIHSVLLTESNTIYNRLLSDITNGVLSSGDRLITTQLAERYNSSINPVREALKQLEGEGFVTFQKNSGARVTHFEYATMRDVFELLQLLEPYFLQWFVDHYTDAQINRLRDIANWMRQLDTSDFAGFRELDTAFHWQMYRNHYNKTAVQLWRQKKLVLQAMHANLAISKRRFLDAIDEHGEMLDLIASDQAGAAIEALRQHIRCSGDYWQKVLAK
ncbi:GntR family transcriptional regulator [Neiella sp. HB171785]|uniref:GntR family transcriptional regulator n=1 Tax=Neiella litorisoli TaxID=2771431 RepID=A0A8J6R3L1_9GAMM|nr:GntR family transcriptional regulator [Neiella litorisoli]MBD1390490.1 GntR family transcriptional regulator [Neiella litorisoli]